MTGIAHLVYDTLFDQFGVGLGGALVHLYQDGVLVENVPEGNPITTDETGHWQATLPPGDYSLLFTKGDDSMSRTLTVCADGAPFITALNEVNDVTIRVPEVPLNEIDGFFAIGYASIIAV